MAVRQDRHPGLLSRNGGRHNSRGSWASMCQFAPRHPSRLQLVWGEACMLCGPVRHNSWLLTQPHCGSVLESLARTAWVAMLSVPQLHLQEQKQHSGSPVLVAVAVVPLLLLQPLHADPRCWAVLPSLIRKSLADLRPAW